MHDRTSTTFGAARPSGAGADPTVAVEDLARSATVGLSAAPATIPGYVLTDQLGQGAYGQVWRAVRIGAGQDVAVKIFTAPGHLDWRYLQREVDRLLRVAEHPHIVTLLDANLQNAPPFYVMALLRCGSLANLCRAGQPVGDVAQIVVWFEQIVDALDFAHGKGLLHCDIKPGNILLDEEGSVRVVDFGQSQLRGQAAQALGTLNYMSPEQAVVADHHQEPPDPSVSWDIYSLGATVYALLTGHPPHTCAELQNTLTSVSNVRLRIAQYRQHVLNTPITPIRNINRAVDRDLAGIVEHCLHPDPENRYHSVAAIAEDLRRRHACRPLRCHPRNRLYVLRRFLRRNLGMVIISIAAVVALATVSATLVYRGQYQLEKLRSEGVQMQTYWQRRERQLLDEINRLRPQPLDQSEAAED